MLDFTYNIQDFNNKVAQIAEKIESYNSLSYLPKSNPFVTMTNGLFPIIIERHLKNGEYDIYFKKNKITNRWMYHTIPKQDLNHPHRIIENIPRDFGSITDVKRWDIIPFNNKDMKVWEKTQFLHFQWNHKTRGEYVNILMRPHELSINKKVILDSSSTLELKYIKYFRIFVVNQMALNQLFVVPVYRKIYLIFSKLDPIHNNKTIASIYAEQTLSHKFDDDDLGIIVNKYNSSGYGSKALKAKFIKINDNKKYLNYFHFGDIVVDEFTYFDEEKNKVAIGTDDISPYIGETFDYSAKKSIIRKMNISFNRILDDIEVINITHINAPIFDENEGLVKLYKSNHLSHNFDTIYSIDYADIARLPKNDVSIIFWNSFLIND